MSQNVRHYANANPAYNFNQLTGHYHINIQLSVKR